MERREFIAGAGAAAAGALYPSSPIYAQAVGGVTHRTVDANGIRLHFAEQGEGPLVVLCHGFPEFVRGQNDQSPNREEGTTQSGLCRFNTRIGPCSRTEHQHQHPFLAVSSSARGFNAADFSVGISTGSGFCACGESRTAPRAGIGWIVGSTPRILGDGRADTWPRHCHQRGRLPTLPRGPRRRASSSAGTNRLPPAVTCSGRR
jgi:hypothetical protein